MAEDAVFGGGGRRPARLDMFYRNAMIKQTDLCDGSLETNRGDL